MSRWILIIGLATACLIGVGHLSAVAGEDDGGALPLPPAPDLDDTVAGDDGTAGDGTTPTTQASSEDGARRRGRINAARVNVRAGPGSESPPYEILRALPRGTPLTVYAKVNGWYKIGYPQGHPCYVHQNFVQGNIPTDIPAGGVKRTIKGNKVRLRVRPWSRSTAVGFVNDGESVTVLGIRGEWLKIVAPPSARAWVSAKYATVDGPVAQGTTADTPAHTGGVTPLVPKKKTTLQKEYEKRLAEIQQRELARAAQEQQKFKTAVQSIEDRLRQIDAETNKEQALLASRNVDSVDTAQGPGAMNQPGFTGWVEYIGRAFKRPADFRLVKGGETVFLMRSSRLDLAQYVNRRVIVDGAVELAPGFEANVLIVNSLKVLAEPPSNVSTKVKVRHPWRPSRKVTPPTASLRLAPISPPVRRRSRSRRASSGQLRTDSPPPAPRKSVPAARHRRRFRSRSRMWRHEQKMNSPEQREPVRAVPEPLSNRRSGYNTGGSRAVTASAPVAPVPVPVAPPAVAPPVIARPVVPAVQPQPLPAKDTWTDSVPVAPAPAGREVSTPVTPAAIVAPVPVPAVPIEPAPEDMAKDQNPVDEDVVPLDLEKKAAEVREADLKKAEKKAKEVVEELNLVPVK